MGYKIEPRSINLVGLRRSGFSREDIAAIRSAYKLLYRSNLRLEDALARIDAEVPNEPVREIAAFVRASKRGICRERGSRDTSVEE
jgi:UDP-N-acetylglucosamine acyltransferase